jgi:hypothetical protein
VLVLRKPLARWTVSTYVNDVESLCDGGLCVEREAGVNLSGDLAGNNLEDLATELNEETVKGSINLVILVLAVLLSVLNGIVNELGVLGLLCGGEDQGRVGGGILRLVLVDGSKVTRVTDDSLILFLVMFCVSSDDGWWGSLEGCVVLKWDE